VLHGQQELAAAHRQVKLTESLGARDHPRVGVVVVDVVRADAGVFAAEVPFFAEGVLANPGAEPHAFGRATRKAEGIGHLVVDADALLDRVD
jgi:hypothetical protein